MSVSKESLLYYLPVISLRGRRLLAKLILAIAVSLIISAVSALTLYSVWGVGEETVPFSEEKGGAQAAVLNVIYVLIMVIVATFIVIVLLKKGKINFLKALLAFFMGLIAGISAQLVLPLWVVIGLYYFFLAINFSISIYVFQVMYFVAYYLSLIVFFTGMVIALICRKENLRNILILLSAVWVGALFGLYSGRITPLLLMCLFAVYDIIAVSKGPLRMLIEELEIISSEREAKEITFARHASIGLGAGDIVFFSLATSYCIGWIQPIFRGMLCAIIVSLVCIIGLLLTIYLARFLNKPVAPALPISMFLAVTVIILFIVFS